MEKSIPILYSLQNCPYAIRARFAINRSRKQVLIRAIKLNNKPESMLIASPKGSVPILVVDKENIIDESLDIMIWALSEDATEGSLHHGESATLGEMLSIIKDFDTRFIPALEGYCCAKRYHESNLIEFRERCAAILATLETQLSLHPFLYGETETIVDIALFPFIRKFARVERQWYLQSPYPKLRHWLNSYLQSPQFTKVMAKHELWLENYKQILFGH